LMRLDGNKEPSRTEVGEYEARKGKNRTNDSKKNVRGKSNGADRKKRQ